MAFLPLSIILNLRRELEGTNVEILTWGCDGYDDGIKQWSDSCDEQVVSYCDEYNAAPTANIDPL
jgi:hypothetical protein